MKAALTTLFALFVGSLSHASTEGHLWNPAKVAVGSTVALPQNVRAYQHLDDADGKEIESRYTEGTKIVVDAINHDVTGIPGFRTDRYTYQAHLPDCIKDCRMTFGFSRSKTLYNIDVSKIAEHVYFPKQHADDDLSD